MQNFEHITLEISKRLNYAEGTLEHQTYEKKCKEIEDLYFMQQDRTYNSRIFDNARDQFVQLENEKLMNIKNKLTIEDNMFFSEIIRENLPFIKDVVDEKTTQLKLLGQQNKSLYQQIYEKIRGKSHEKMVELNESINKLEQEIHDLTKVIKDINTLLPFYQ